jgi:hypothetical protein
MHSWRPQVLVLRPAELCGRQPTSSAVPLQCVPDPLLRCGAACAQRGAFLGQQQAALGLVEHPRR